MFMIKFATRGNPWTDTPDEMETQETIVAPTMKKLREEVLAFQRIDRSVNWEEATLYKNDKFVGYMTREGRFWEKPYWEGLGKEIEI